MARAALQFNAAAVILAHNHPSGSSDPSAEDRALTDRIKQALGLIDVKVLDHVVIGATAHSLPWHYSAPPSQFNTEKNMGAMLFIILFICDSLIFIAGFIWLAVIGSWSLIGWGLALVAAAFMALPVLMSISIPAGFLVAAAVRKQSTVLVAITIFMQWLLLSVAFATWFSLVFYLICKEASFQNRIPAILWAFFPCIGPVSNICRKETIATDKGGAATLSIVGTIACTVAATMLIFWPSPTAPYITLYSFMLVGAIFASIISLQEPLYMHS